MLLFWIVHVVTYWGKQLDMTKNITLCNDRRQVHTQALRGNSFSHLLYQEDKAQFWSADRTAYLMYASLAGNHIVLGDPVGYKADALSLLREFMENSKANGRGMLFYQASSANLSAYREAGFRVLKTGEEAVIQLSAFHTNGRDWLKIRNRKNKVDREGYRYEVSLPPHSSKLMQQVKRVSEAWLGSRKELSFSVGSLSEQYMNKHPIVTLMDADRQLVAFLSLSGYKAGDEEPHLCIDLMRYAEEAPQGAMEVLFVCALTWAKEQGYITCSLGVSPLANACDHRMLKLIRTCFHSKYNFDGLRHFKAKFLPQWEDRHLVYSGRFALWPMIIIALLIRRKAQIQVGDSTSGAAVHTT
jgi:phosphatidylglycerol lysyltransferase